MSELMPLNGNEALTLASARQRLASVGETGRRVTAGAVLTQAGRIHVALDVEHWQDWGAITAEAGAVSEALLRDPAMQVSFSVAVNRNGTVVAPRDAALDLLEEYGPVARVGLPDPERPEGAGAISLGTLKARRLDRAQVLGVILAGGRATRMGGLDKGLLPLANRRLIDHVLDRLSPQVGAVALNANGPAARFAGLGLPVLPDSLPDWPGPLAGVLAGLDWAAGRGARAIVTVAADTPFFPRDLVAGLLSHAGRSGLCLAVSPDRQGMVQRHPTFGLWPVALREDLRAALTGGLRKIVLWTDGHGAGRALFDSVPFDPFFNVNTPEDLRVAEGLAARA
jgi:molybdopterin-guanine dinucleotide biosynthesis protein A